MEIEGASFSKRMRSEVFPFIVGGWTSVCVVCVGGSRRRFVAGLLIPLQCIGEVFGEGFGWKHEAADPCEIA